MYTIFYKGFVIYMKSNSIILVKLPQAKKLNVCNYRIRAYRCGERVYSFFSASKSYQYF